MVNKGNCLCAGTKTKFLQANTKLKCSKPRAGQARFACQVNGGVSRQQQEPTGGLSESGRNLLRLRREGCQLRCDSFREAINPLATFLATVWETLMLSDSPRTVALI